MNCRGNNAKHSYLPVSMAISIILEIVNPNKIKSGVK
jgi:hypothetical protein